MAPFGCPFLNVLLTFHAHTNRAPQKKLRAPFVWVPFRPQTPPPVRYFIPLSLHFGHSLGVFISNFQADYTVCHSIAIGLSAHCSLLHLYSLWYCLHSNKTALRWFLFFRLKTDIQELYTEKGLFLIFVGVVSVLFFRGVTKPV